MRALLILGLSFLAVACSAPSGSPDAGGPPRIATIPGRVDFGVDAGTPVNIGESANATLTLYNSGGQVLTMSAVTITGDPAFTAARPPTMSLDAGARTDVIVTFSPMEARVHTGRVNITSNAQNGATVAITVLGLGKTP